MEEPGDPSVVTIHTRVREVDRLWAETVVRRASRRIPAPPGRGVDRGRRGRDPRPSSACRASGGLP
jgi:hypothetical protein